MLLKITNNIYFKEVFLLWFIKFFDKKSPKLADISNKGSGIPMLQNDQLAEELLKPIIKFFF